MTDRTHHKTTAKLRRRAVRDELADRFSAVMATLCEAIQHKMGNHRLISLLEKSRHCRLFHAVTVVKNLHKFTKTLCRETDIEPACLVHALVYIRRLWENERVFALDGRPDGFIFSWYTIHRVILGCLALADKMFDDHHDSLRVYAAITGMNSRYMSGIERELLNLLDFQTAVLEPEYTAAEAWLLSDDHDVTLDLELIFSAVDQAASGSADASVEELSPKTAAIRGPSLIRQMRSNSTESDQRHRQAGLSLPTRDASMNLGRVSSHPALSSLANKTNVHGKAPNRGTGSDSMRATKQLSHPLGA